MSASDQRFSFLAAAALAGLWALPVAAGSEIVSDEIEFPAETAAIVTATAALFDAVEGSEDRARPAAPVIRLPRSLTPASLSTIDGKAVVLTENGPVKHLTGYRITWYPTDRFLGSVDFMGTWNGNLNLVCGYVTWDLTDPESPVLDEVQANYLDIGDLALAHDEKIHAALLDANCAYGAIDANYAFFE